MKKATIRLTGLLCGLSLLSAIGATGMTAVAYTPEEVAAYAYEIDYPNAASYVNQAYALIDSGKVSEEEIPSYCARAMEVLQKYASERQSVVEEVFDEAAQTDANNNNPNSTSGSTSTESTETVTDQEFTKMPLKDKISYVNSLSDEERTAFLESMSNDARNSILKEMDTDKQLEMIATMIESSDALGLNFSLDSISDDAVVISARDEDGNLVDVTTLGNSVEETGIAYTIPVLLGGGAILLACAGFGAVLWYTDRKNK